MLKYYIDKLVDRSRLVAATAALASAIVLAFGFSAAGAASIDSQDLDLSVGDTVRITVFDELDMSGEFEVDVSGKISVPLVGPLQAVGMNSREFETSLVEALKGDYLVDPRVSVEVIEFGPVYVVGSVNKPGAYAYRPGLTVVGAVALASGYRTEKFDDLAMQLNLTEARVNRDLLQSQYYAALVREARLISEYENSDVIRLPRELAVRADTDQISGLLFEEKKEKWARKSTYEEKLAVFTSRLEEFDREIRYLRSFDRTAVRQIEIINKQVDDMTNLVKKGLAKRSKMFDLQRQQAALEGDRLQQLSYLSKARQGRRQVESFIIKLKGDLQTEIFENLTLVREDIRAMTAKMDMWTENLYSNQAALHRVSGYERQRRNIQISVARVENGVVRQFDADENVLLLPGDIVRVPGIEYEMLDLLPEGERQAQLTSSQPAD